MVPVKGSPTSRTTFATEVPGAQLPLGDSALNLAADKDAIRYPVTRGHISTSGKAPAASRLFLFICSVHNNLPRAVF